MSSLMILWAEQKREAAEIAKQIARLESRRAHHEETAEQIRSRMTLDDKTRVASLHDYDFAARCPPVPIERPTTDGS